MASYIDWIRAFCLTLPHTTEDVQWEHDLLFRIAGKMFCVANMEPELVPTKIAFKCTPEKFAELVSPECKLYLQPEWSKAATVTPGIIEYIKQHPQWELSLQIHKYINVP